MLTLLVRSPNPHFHLRPSLLDDFHTYCPLIAAPTGALSVVTGTQAELAAQATAITGASTSLYSHQSKIMGVAVSILGLGLSFL